MRSLQVILGLTIISFILCIFVFNLDKKFYNCKYKRRAYEIMESETSLSNISHEDLTY